MKFITALFLLTQTLNLSAQDKIIGHYRDHFGNSIQLNADSTFKYQWNFDLASSWTKGTWSLKNDTVYFHMISIYDTLRRQKSNDMVTDTLILSTNEVSEHISPDQYPAMFLSSGGQNRSTHPKKLLFKKNRLYNIKNGELETKKQKSFWDGKKWNPWYFKCDD